MNSVSGLRSRLAVISAVVLQVSLASQPLYSQSANKNSHWVGTWACSPLHPARLADASTMQQADSGKQGVTIREVAHVSGGGDTLRVRFSNLFGTGPLVIGTADIATTAQGSALVPGTDHAITFHGQPSVSIPAGALAFSDPIPLKAAPLSNLTVSFYLPNPSGPITEHQLANATSYHAPGNAVSQIELQSPTTVNTWEYLNGIDVLTSNKDSAIVTLGDSITDGAYSSLNANDRWPDELARRLQADAKYRNFSIVNEAISGNRLLLDGAGPNALSRFDRDVIAQSGAKYLIILEGINDIGTLERDANDHTTAADLILALDQLVERAHTHGILVIGATLTPYKGAGYYSDTGEAVRKAVNEWIRTSHTFDGVVDFDAAVRDPDHPGTFLPKYEHGDHLHPDDAGYKAMGDAIDLKLFTVKGK